MAGQTLRGASRTQVGNKGKRQLPWNRVLLLLVILALVVGLFIVTPWLMSWLNRPIARVEVHSEFNYLSQDDVERVLNPFLQSRFFNLKLPAIQQALLATPWVKTASVRRQWPDTVQVSLQEYQPIARWGSSHLISNEGKVFRPGSVAGFSLPLLVGPEDSAEQVMQQYLAISQLLRPVGLRPESVMRSDSGSWRFTVGHVDVNLGRDRLMERLQRFVRLYHAELESRWQQVRRVDLRYLNGASVAWRTTPVGQEGVERQAVSGP